ncbi:hypothetical protein K8R04_05170 [Candidatus Uhrbacteria bacterium]|nr:hypothetical protein [Candidatus Uhrbacteria bacterium]
MFEEIIGYLPFLNFDVDAFLNVAGNDPFSAMIYLFLKGGWLILIPVLWFMVKNGWLEYIQNKHAAKREWILLRISVPKASEQTVRAIENLFALLAGAHSPASWTETWFEGATQPVMSIEIASIEGQVSYYVYCLKGLRDLIEAAVYAQYPDAEIEPVEDYARQVPSEYPNEEWDVWCTEMTNVMPDPYPLRTYPEFEDKVSGEFKGPMASFLEVFSRLGPGEQAWYQIILQPTDQRDFRKRSEAIVKKIKGIKETPKVSILDQIISIPLSAFMEIANMLMGSTMGGGEKKEEKRDGTPEILKLSPGERFVLESVERKASKIGFNCKIRFLYVAKKDVMKKSRAVQPFIGSIKQVNTFNMQALKPSSKVGVNGTLWWFKDRRNAQRKSKMVRAYRSRSGWSGLPKFFMSSEELATLWHFPILLQVKAPGLRRIEAKKSEAPANIPFG